MHINVHFQNNDYVKKLEKKLEQAELRAEVLNAELNKLRSKLKDEQYVNLELIDLAKSLGAKPRPGLDIRNW